MENHCVKEEGKQYSLKLHFFLLHFYFKTLVFAEFIYLSLHALNSEYTISLVCIKMLAYHFTFPLLIFFFFFTDTNSHPPSQKTYYTIVYIVYYRYTMVYNRLVYSLFTRLYTLSFTQRAPTGLWLLISSSQQLAWGTVCDSSSEIQWKDN